MNNSNTTHTTLTAPATTTQTAGHIYTQSIQPQQQYPPGFNLQSPSPSHQHHQLLSSSNQVPNPYHQQQQQQQQMLMLAAAQQQHLAYQIHLYQQQYAMYHQLQQQQQQQQQPAAVTPITSPISSKPFTMAGTSITQPLLPQYSADGGVQSLLAHRQFPPNNQLMPHGSRQILETVDPTHSTSLANPMFQQQPGTSIAASETTAGRGAPTGDSGTSGINVTTPTQQPRPPVNVLQGGLREAIALHSKISKADANRDATSGRKIRRRRRRPATVGDMVDRLAEFERVKALLGSKNLACAALGCSKGTINAYTNSLRNAEFLGYNIEQIRNTKYKELKQMLAQHKGLNKGKRGNSAVATDSSDEQDDEEEGDDVDEPSSSSGAGTDIGAGTSAKSTPIASTRQMSGHKPPTLPMPEILQRALSLSQTYGTQMATAGSITTDQMATGSAPGSSGTMAALVQPNYGGAQAYMQGAAGQFAGVPQFGQVQNNSAMQQYAAQQHAQQMAALQWQHQLYAQQQQQQFLSQMSPQQQMQLMATAQQQQVPPPAQFTVMSPRLLSMALTNTTHTTSGTSTNLAKQSEAAASVNTAAKPDTPVKQHEAN